MPRLLLRRQRDLDVLGRHQVDPVLARRPRRAPAHLVALGVDIDGLELAEPPVEQFLRFLLALVQRS